MQKMRSGEKNPNAFLENAETQNRTADTAVFSRMLYQLSYLGECKVTFYTEPARCQLRDKKTRCPFFVIEERTALSLAWLSPRTDADARR